MSVSRSKPDFGGDEILYVSDFEQVHHEPSFTARRCTEDVGDLGHLVIPVIKLLHVTHDKEAKQITKEDTFEFKAFAKVGRRYRGSWKKNPGSDRYEQIIHRKVFPGYYSWWSVHLSKSAPGGMGYTTLTDIERGISTLRSQSRLNVSVPSYLKSDPESMYGGWAFECDFMDLLDCYVKLQSPRDSKRSINDICIRIGGTLTYKLEICYVLIVHCVDDNDALSAFPILKDSKLFHTNGQIDDEGRINPEGHKCLTFHPKHNVAWVAGEGCCYENVAFAFYFSNRDHVMTVNSQFCNKHSIIHKYECCAKQVNNKCPDQM